jgi:hypothetical protein
MLIFLGITTSWTRIPKEELDSAGNYHLMEADSGRQDPNARKILQTITISGSATPSPLLYTTKVNFFLNLETKKTIKQKN